MLYKILDFCILTHRGVKKLSYSLTKTKKKIFGFNIGKLIVEIFRLSFIILIPYFIGLLMIKPNTGNGPEWFLFIATWVFGSITISITFMFAIIILAFLQTCGNMLSVLFKDFIKWIHSFFKYLRD